MLCYALHVLCTIPSHTTGPPLDRTTTTDEPPTTESVTQSQQCTTVDHCATTDPSSLPTRITSDLLPIESATPTYVAYYVTGSFGALICILLVVVALICILQRRKKSTYCGVSSPSEFTHSHHLFFISLLCACVFANKLAVCMTWGYSSYPRDGPIILLCVQWLQNKELSSWRVSVHSWINLVKARML